EREIYALDLVGWLLSFGRQPIKRLLPNQRLVLMVKHLGGAARRLAACRIADAERQRLAGLLRHALEMSEQRLRHCLRLEGKTTLNEVRLQPQNFPERFARDKLVEEMLDLVIERGFLTMGDLRDALSRNNLKLPDVDGPGEFFLGDQLIRTNRRLGRALDGVY